jgi:hypothetical protein
MKKLFLILVCLILLCGCSKHAIKYNIEDPVVKWDKKHVLAIRDFKDVRPIEEREGEVDEFLEFASKDKHFKQPITKTLDDALKQEFSDVAIYVLDFEDDNPRACHYIISGEIKHFQVILKLPKTSVVPYLKTVASIWTKDQFAIAIELDVTLYDNLSGKKILEKTYSFNENQKLPTGLFSLARYKRGFNYKLKLLDKAFCEVVKEVRNDVIKIIDEQYD